MGTSAMRIIIRGCRERSPWVDYLQERLPDASVIWDARHHALETFLRALARAGKAPALHIEDDVILTRDFRVKTEAVIREHADMPVQFFSLARKRDVLGARLEPGRSFMMGQCFYLPAGMSAELLEYADTWSGIKEHPTGLDFMVRDYLRAKRLRYWLHIPSLVQHRAGTSLINPRRARTRQSPTFTDPDL